MTNYYQNLYVLGEHTRVKQRLSSHLFITILLLLSAFEMSGQNYFKDPTFDEPQAPKNTIPGDCDNRGELFDEYSKVYFRVGKKSPDIVVPNEEGCKLHIDDPLIKSQCLRMVFAHSVSTVNTIFKEPVFTRLKQPLEESSTYEISFDILCNPAFYSFNENILPYRTDHINVVLINSKIGIKDTISLPVTAKAFLDWERTRLVFKSKSAFDVVQFDFFSEEFFNSDSGNYLHTYLDNFELVKFSKDPGAFDNDSVDSKKVTSKRFTYYFESDEKELSENEKSKLINDFRNFTHQDVDSVVIEGFADTTHSVDYNLSLSSRRALYAEQIIKELLGDDSIKFSSVGKGIDVHKARRKARRVDVKIEFGQSDEN